MMRVYWHWRNVTGAQVAIPGSRTVGKPVIVKCGNCWRCSCPMPQTLTLIKNNPMLTTEPTLPPLAQFLVSRMHVVSARQAM